MEQPNKNVQLTFEQLQQINVVENRLGNLQNEIALAVKLLPETRNDLEQATKNKLYQEELLAIVSVKVSEKQSISTNLDEVILEKRVELNQLLSEISTKKSLFDKKEMEFKDREDKISEKEQQLSAQGNAIGKERVILENDKAEFKSKVDKLQEVISTF